MILNIILIVFGLLFIIATGVLVSAIRRAPIGIEDENGFRSMRAPGTASKGNFLAAGATRFPNPSANSPITVV